MQVEAECHATDPGGMCSALGQRFAGEADPECFTSSMTAMNAIAPKPCAQALLRVGSVGKTIVNAGQSCYDSGSPG